MGKIRKDLDGVVYAVNQAGNYISLKAKDTVPDGYFVGGHALKDGDPSDQTPPWNQTPPLQASEPGPAPASKVYQNISQASTTHEAPTPPTTTQPADAQQGTPAAPNPPAQTSLTPPPKSGAGSSADVWRDYAVKATAAAGLNIDLPADAKRDEIIAALAEADIATE